ncbi:Tetratricopeptide repeat-containing protein [Pustulibacterium marinum]|uniref:Tetratricopeptide repeat-containing protein n=1 Tax=Pustulibacterium marinum TaxID=1224947 RepID=A0A1I7F5W0_9FLAO|nr:hypothetical protein [Pustulibacterium marinum]SFU31515.1 Tetratricopeptide repeat-containing protein [Pustulibacterium marinum]
MRYFICIFLVLFTGTIFSQSDFQKGKQFFDEAQYQSAITHLKKTVDSHPTDAVAIELLGDAYGHLEQWDHCITTYKKLVEIDDSNANYHYKYGGALGMKALENKMAALGLLDEIETEFVTAAELDANHIDTRWALVNFFTELPGILGGKQEKALKYANELEVISPVDGYLAKGFIYKDDDDFAQAEHYLKKAVVTGGSATCYEKLSELYQDENRYNSALFTLKEAYKALRINNYQYEIGKLSAVHGIEVHTGIESLESYISNYKNTDSYPLEWAYLRLAQLNRFQNHKQEALDWIDKSIAMNNDFQLAKKERSKILKL